MGIIRLPAGTEMTPTVLSELILEHKKQVSSRFKKLDDAYRNKYEIFDYIKHPKKPDYKPDNRISVNYAKYISDTFNGFFMGIPVKVTSNDENVASFLELINTYNDIDDHNAELSKQSSNLGRAYEMYYNDEDGNIGITHLSAMNAFMVYDDSILSRPMYFVRYYIDSENVERGSWSDDTIVQHFVLSNSYVWDGEPFEHNFDGIPATEYIENEERLGTYEGAMPAIDAYNKALSEKANDVDYFADAYLKILGAEVDKNDVRFIRSNRIMNFNGNGEGKNPEVDFLQKPDADTTQENLLNRLDRQIFHMCMVANISDESFGSDSGIALRYKLTSMSNLAKVKERKFTASMNRRYKVLFSNPIALINGIHPDDWMKLEYHFTLNYPANLSDEADVASKLEGIVSKETQLKVISIVEDPKEELDKIDAENPVVDLLAQRYGDGKANIN